VVIGGDGYECDCEEAGDDGNIEKEVMKHN